MAILIDPPRWPAHGTLFSHLVSDESLAELHAFAADAGLSPKAFDHDHYDVPERLFRKLTARGALAVSGTQLVRRLLDSGLRVHAQDRTPKRAAVVPQLRGRWAGLLPEHADLGTELLERWGEPHRHYHDVRHLAQILDALEELGCDDPLVHLAAWFHDAVYVGQPGDDERGSARLADSRLEGILSAADRAEVVRLVLLTESHAAAPGDVRGALLCDADLSILGMPPARYSIYARDVRIDYEQIPERLYRSGRLQVLETLSERDPLFSTDLGRRLWDAQARENLAGEIAFHRRAPR